MVSTSKATKQPLENNPKSDKHLISPYNITSDSHIQVTGSYKGNYHQLKELMIVKKVSLSVPWEMCREKNGECAN